MKKSFVAASVLGVLLVVTAAVALGRGRGGGGGGARMGGGGARVGPAGGVHAGGARGGGAVNGFGAGGVGARSSHGVVGPAGGSRSINRAQGSYTTPRGGTIDYRGAGTRGTTPGVVQGGRYLGGVQVTTPGGREINRVGHGGAVVGPGGNGVGGLAGTTVGVGPNGSFASHNRGGVAVGPYGTLAGGTRAGVASGSAGVVRGLNRAGIATGPYGAVGVRNSAVAGWGGTYYRSAAAVRGQGVAVRQGVARYPCFQPGWYARHPGVWLGAGLAAGSVWRAATWPTYQSWCGYTGYAPYYTFGDNIVLQDSQVYIDGNPVNSVEAYAQQAADLAKAGQEANGADQGEWLPLGVFAMVQGDEQTSNHIFQLAVNKRGILRGNYYDAVTDTTLPIKGSVHPKTQRAAWTVGDRPSPVYEAGIANLTEPETTMLVHYGGDRSQQFILIRIEEPNKTE